MPIFNKQKVYNRVPGSEIISWHPQDNVATKGPIDALKKYFINQDNVVPNLVNEAKSILSDPNKSVLAKEDALFYLAHEDAKAKYLNLPQRYGLIEKSKYVPSNAKNKDADYYRFKHMNPDNYVLAATWILPIKAETSTQHIDQLLNNYKLSKGIDPEKGQYISIYDIWDYNTKVYGGGKDNVGKFIGGKPFEIYDRIYLDEYYGVNTPKLKSGEYEGGYLPEIEILYKPITKNAQR